MQKPREEILSWGYGSIVEWMTFYYTEPFGEQRADLRMGINTSVLANINRGDSPKVYKPSDFMPFEESQVETPAQRIKNALSHLRK